MFPEEAWQKEVLAVIFGLVGHSPRTYLFTKVTALFPRLTLFCTCSVH